MIYAYADPALVSLQIIHAVRHRLARFGNQEVMHADRLWAAFRSPVAPGILEIADEFLLLRVHRDRWLHALLKASDLVVDILELRIPVMVLKAFPCFLIRLQAVPELVQQIGYRRVADIMPHGVQCDREVSHTLRRPTQRRIRLPCCGGLDQCVEIRQKRGVLLDHRFASTARSSLAVRTQRRVRLCFQFPQAALNRRPRYTGRTLNERDPPVSERPGLRRRPEALRPFRQHRGECLVLRPQRTDVHSE